MILQGEIKDPKMSIFSSDFQTIIKHLFPLYFFSIINEFEEEFFVFFFNGKETRDIITL